MKSSVRRRSATVAAFSGVSRPAASVCEPTVDELRTILGAMDEGVLTFDMERRLHYINDTAVRLLKLDKLPALGSAMEDTIPYASVRSLIERALMTDLPIEEPFSVDKASEALLQGYARPLFAGDSSTKSGVVIIISDITRMRHLENVRRDFVANVSHELKTPITSIKGFVETLLDGAIRDPESADRFLRIIARQADRLNNIFEDLLVLARLEQQGEASEIQVENVALRPILEAAVQNHERAALERSIKLSVSCAHNLRHKVNARLIEQAVGNLIDNAVKYSDPHKRVEVAVVKTRREFEIRVRDHGCGIAEDHLPRLWERFYRADAARSRKCGGTGLGLAIVKHIAQAHGGYATVESEVGVGSTFSLHLPAAPLRRRPAKGKRAAA